MAKPTPGNLWKEATTLNVREHVLQLGGTAAIGLVAGLAAVAFHETMILLAGALVQVPSKWPGAVFALFVLTAMGTAAWFTGWLMTRFARDAPGSGIPQVKVAYHRGQVDFSWHLVWVKFFGGALSIGTGSSLGREGPTIHIGAALASKIAKVFGENASTRKNAICAGSAAGLAAAFGSPLAGVTLVLEEIAGGKNEENFAGRSLLAAALASSVVLAVSGDASSLPVGPALPLSWRALWMAPLVAVVAGLAGLAFQYLTLAIRERCKQSAVPGAWKLAMGTVAGGAFALAAFALTGRLGVFGLGDHDLIESLNGGIVWTVALCLLVAKLLATAFCYGAGGCGGIFAPLLFFGAMAGVLVTGLSPAELGLTSQDKTLLALTGMTACLGAVVRAPITSILIVMEMTRQIYALPALMIAAVISVYMNRLSFRGNFYDEALRQDGVRLDRD
jgi:CIC family chloride channel protein